MKDDERCELLVDTMVRLIEEGGGPLVRVPIDGNRRMKVRGVLASSLRKELGWHHREVKRVLGICAKSGSVQKLGKTPGSFRESRVIWCLG